MPKNSPDGFVLTWRYTQASLWLYVVALQAGAVTNMIGLQDGLVRQSAGLILVALNTAVAGVLIGRARPGLGRGEAPSVRLRWACLAPGLAFLALWSATPAGPIGYVLVPWITASLLAVPLASRERTRWLVMSGVAIVAVRLAAGTLTGLPLDRALGAGPARAGVVSILVFAVLAPSLVLFQVWLWDLMVRVRDSGQAEAELVRVRERLRFAADLHDVQGHHLQVLALKTELAERQLDHDVEAARTTLREAQAVAREALTQTRDLAHGYRAVSLREEATNAAAILEAAGANCRLDLPEDIDHPLFASLLREATTNVLRHSSAQHVEVAAAHGADVTLRITNDRPAPAQASGDGSGIPGLRDRFAAAGGHIDVEHDVDHFSIAGTLPREVVE